MKDSMLTHPKIKLCQTLALPSARKSIVLQCTAACRGNIAPLARGARQMGKVGVKYTHRGGVSIILIYFKGRTNSLESLAGSESLAGQSLVGTEIGDDRPLAVIANVVYLSTDQYSASLTLHLETLCVDKIR